MKLRKGFEPSERVAWPPMNRTGRATVINLLQHYSMANHRILNLKRPTRCKRASVSISLLQLAAAHAKIIRRRHRNTFAYYQQLGTNVSLGLFSDSVEQGAAQQLSPNIPAISQDYTLGDNGLCLHATTAEAMHAILLATHVGLFGHFIPFPE